LRPDEPGKKSNAAGVPLAKTGSTEVGRSDWPTRIGAALRSKEE
jgi:hypothetical protein